MSSRGRQMLKTMAKKLGGEQNMKPALKEVLLKNIPNSNIVMNRAKRGLFAGKHIRFNNRVSEDGGNKSKRTWKPNVQQKRLFSYVLDRHIRVKVTTHALRTIDKFGGIDEYLLRTPYQKMDTEMGLLWKAKIERLYEELGSTEALFLSVEDEAKLSEEFKKMKVEARKLLPKKLKKIEGGAKEKETEVVDDVQTKERDFKDQPYPGRGAIIFNF